jgi:membrane protein DedA with SNARE-associated domain
MEGVPSFIAGVGGTYGRLYRVFQGISMEQIAQFFVDFVKMFGYAGIFIMTFLESTFMPIPSEVTMIPAGYLVHQGEMSLFWVLFASITGTICGSVAMYFIAASLGRKFLYAYGKYMFFNRDKMTKLDSFFASHGEISIFTARLIPGVRHVISFPAGLAHMNLKKFCIYTGAGGSIWMATLVLVGYLIGGNKELIKHYKPYVTSAAVATVVLLVVAYVWNHRKKAGGVSGIIG